MIMGIIIVFELFNFVKYIIDILWRKFIESEGFYDRIILNVGMML